MSNLDSVVVDGVTYDADEVYMRTLHVTGTQPTDFEQWDRVNVLAQQKLGKQNSGGKGQAPYHYGEAKDITKFHEHEYPYFIDVKMVSTTDKNNRPVQLIIWADFANVREIEQTIRKSPSANKPAIAPVNKA